VTPELTALALAGLLQAIQIALFAVAANLDVGPGHAMSARDRPPSRPMAERTGRIQRAMNNHFEGLILFTLAVVVVTFTKISTPFTTACSWVYLAARVAYVPAYVLGWRPGRSLVWAAGWLASVLMLLAALL